MENGHEGVSILETQREIEGQTLHYKNFSPYFNFEPSPLHGGHQLGEQLFPRVGAPAVEEVTHDV